MFLFQETLNENSPETLNEKDVFLIASNHVLSQFYGVFSSGKFSGEEISKRILELYEVLITTANNIGKK